MYTVTFNPEVGASVTVLADAAAAILSNGFGGWETVDRPRRASLVRFKGRGPFKQDIAVLFDGVASRKSQETDIRNLEAMGTQPGDLQLPPRLKVSGLAYKTSLWWVIDDITWDSQDVIKMDISGRPARVRQAGVVHLLEFIDDKVITTPAQPKVNHPVKKVTVPDGMTLKQIAQMIYGDPDKWFIIYQNNLEVIPIPDPRQFIPKGTALVTPGGNVPTFTVP